MRSTRHLPRVLVVMSLTLLLTVMMSGWSPGSSGSRSPGSSGPGALFAQAPAPSAQSAPATPDRLLSVVHGISSNVILDWVKELASDKYGGRLTGTPGYEHELMPGANDNASAVGVLLAAAEAIAKANVPLKRTLVFILFGSEEQGVKGSEYDVAHPFVPNGNVTAFINLEGVDRGERIGVGSGKNCPQIFAVMDRVSTQYVHRTMTASANANLARPRQDAAHFLWANIPTVSIGTSGAPSLPYASYHTSKDRWDTLTPEIMEDLARIVFLSTVELANK